VIFDIDIRHNMESETPLLPVTSDHQPNNNNDTKTLPKTRLEIRRRIFGAAWPQALVVCCRMTIDLTNVSILGYLGTDALAGSAFAGVVTTISAIVLWQGFGDALITLSSQAIGAGNPKLAGVWLQTSLLAISISSIPVAIIWWNAGNLLRAAGPLFGDAGGPSEEIINYSEQYARYSLVWLLPDAWFAAFSQWLNGQQKVRPTMMINFIFVFYNALQTGIWYMVGWARNLKDWGSSALPLQLHQQKFSGEFPLIVGQQHHVQNNI